RLILPAVPLEPTPEEERCGAQAQERGDDEHDLRRIELQLDALPLSGLSSLGGHELLQLSRSADRCPAAPRGAPPAATPLGFLPIFFTACIARSAAWTRLSAVSPCSGKVATPRLALKMMPPASSTKKAWSVIAPPR